MSSEKNNKKKNEEKKVNVKTEINSNNSTNTKKKKTSTEKNNKTINNTVKTNNTKKKKRKRTHTSSANKPKTKVQTTKKTTSSKKNNRTKTVQEKNKKVNNQKNTTTLNSKKTNLSKEINNKEQKTKKTLNKEVKNKVTKRNKDHLVISIKDKPEINKDNLIIDTNNKEDSIIKESNTQNKNKFNHISFTIISIISITLIIIFILSFFINKNININLKGNQNEIIEVYTDYQESGYTATLFNKNINKYIKITSNLNTNNIGTYTINYKLPFFNTHKTTRTITVVDTQAPEITLNGNSSVTIYTDEDYIEEGVTIKDNYDTDLSNNLVIENNLDINTTGTYTIKYSVKDSSNNEASITRTVIVKNKPNNIKTCNTTNPISKYICENNYKVSVGYYNINTQKTYYYNKYEQYYGASLIKTLDALYLYDKNMINNELKSHVKKIITVSDNPSHQYLVNYIGKNNLKEYGNSLGAKYTLVGGDNFGITTVSDQIVYMQKLYSMTNNNQNDELKSYFINTYYNNLLFDNCPTIMHKYGWWGQVFHNSGIVLDENPYIITILTNEAYNDYNKIISTISKLIYEYHKTL